MITGHTVSKVIRIGKTMPLRILLVEDDLLDQKAFARFVAKKNLAYDYVVAETVADAIAAVQRETFDVILIDYMLSDGTGFDVLQAIPTEIPSVFITGIGSEEIAVDALRRGALDYLIKDDDRTYLKLLPLVIDRAIRTKEDEKKRLTLSHAVMSSADSIIITDLHGTITFVNAAFCDMYRCQQEKIIGENCAVLYPHSTNALKHNDMPTYEGEHLRQDGTTFSASVSQSKIVDDRGTNFAHAMVVRDITERNKLIESLESFAHTVAHNLKNPASQILGYANLLADAFDEFGREEMIDYLRTVERQSVKMVKIIDALLLFASTQRLTNVPTVDLDMGAVVAEVAQRLDHMIQENGAQISVQAEFPTVIGYTPWVEEIMVNYMSNAIKYGGQPPIIHIGSDDVKNNKVRFWVRDNGKGLSSDEQAQLFQLFKRVTQAKIEGHGLGLSIVHQIVERLGGEVDVKSEAGHGSEFGFTLPIAL
jgi:PAS domain S-box-containing protein